MHFWQVSAIRGSTQQETLITYCLGYAMQL
uniref:Uncharacterized protein n=1 Tax=Rhizophora mucronata TaxID=61149 RepID=A0A2P2PQC8_RHIMU